jgi:DNA-binding transcriptional LysR family regulator
MGLCGRDGPWLTPEGEDLLVRSRRLLADVVTLGERASALKRGDVGVLRLGATPQVIESLLAGLLPRYGNRHSGVEVISSRMAGPGWMNR